VSDTAIGPGWWQAADNKWYAPELHPDYQSAIIVPVLKEEEPLPSEVAAVYALLPPINTRVTQPVTQSIPARSIPKPKAHFSFVTVGCIVVVAATLVFGATKLLVHKGNNTYTGPIPSLISGSIQPQDQPFNYNLQLLNNAINLAEQVPVAEQPENCSAVGPAVKGLELIAPPAFFTTQMQSEFKTMENDAFQGGNECVSGNLQAGMAQFQQVQSLQDQMNQQLVAIKASRPQ
jgi:hypothetical protein